eukprot:1592015-Heterocapsa_arctica.AAC.1
MMHAVPVWRFSCMLGSCWAALTDQHIARCLVVRPFKRSCMVSAFTVGGFSSISAAGGHCLAPAHIVVGI